MLSVSLTLYITYICDTVVCQHIRDLLGFTGVHSCDPVWWVYTAQLRNEPQEESLSSRIQMTNIF